MNQQRCWRKMQSTRCRTLEMTEYVIREIGLHQWLVFADRQSVAFCTDENEAVKAMSEHSARNRQSRASGQFVRAIPAGVNRLRVVLLSNAHALGAHPRKSRRA